MKAVTILSLLLLASPVFAELTDADLDKIRLIVKEEVKTEITAVRQELTAEIAGVRQEIAAVRQELKAEIAGVRQELKAVEQELKAEIASSEQRITKYIDAKIEGVDKRLLLYNWILIILMPLIVAAVGIPTAIIAWRSGRDRSLERQVETLTQEIETLKQKRSV